MPNGDRAPMNTELRAVAALQGGVFTTAQARSAGITERGFAALLRAGLVTRIRKGVFAEAPLLGAESAASDVADIGAAMLRIRRSAWASHWSALRLHSVDMLGRSTSVHVTTEDGEALEYPGLKVW